MQKGFTLIELLAVIVILSILSMITMFSIDKTLKNSKNELSENQKNNIESAAKTYYIKEGMSEGVSCINVQDLINKGYIESKQVLDPKTKNPMEGSVKITYEANQYSYSYTEEKCPKPVIGRAATASNKTLAGTVPTGNFNPGDEYIVNVDGTNEYHFYVLSTEGDKVNLIMSGNVCSNGEPATEDHNYECSTAWVSKIDYNDDTNYGSEGNNNKGPITAMNYLYEATKNWSNIENINMNYTDEGNTGDYGYGEITTSGNITTITMKDGTATATYDNLKARMIKCSEIPGGGTENLENFPAWMVNGLGPDSNYPTGTKEDIDGIWAYWSLSSYSTFKYTAIDVEKSGGGGARGVNIINDNGVRPVIEVSKSSLSNS